MATGQRDLRYRLRTGTNGSSAPRDEPPIGDLFRQLSDDASRLIRQEIALAKVELRESVSHVGKGATRIGIAAAMGLLGGFAAVAFLVVALGDLIDNYWLSALIVSVVLLGVAAMMAKGAMKELQADAIKPTETIDTIRDDADWAKREIATVKREWKS